MKASGWHSLTFSGKKPIVGRNIEEITTDFNHNGIFYWSLYNSLRFSVELIGKETLFNTIKSEMRKLYKSYNAEFEESMSESAYNATVPNYYADFGRK